MYDAEELALLWINSIIDISWMDGVVSKEKISLGIMWNIKINKFSWIFIIPQGAR